MLAKHSEVDKTVFVGNLHSSVKEEILFELFLQAGPLKKVTIARDREGCQRSYGFVCYKHQEAVPYAIALLNGIRLYGRPIRLQYSSGSSHSDGGAGPSDPPLEPHSANSVFPESPVFNFSAFPGNMCLSQDQMLWNTMVCGYPPQQFSLDLTPPQRQCNRLASAFCPSAPPQPWPNQRFPFWMQPCLQQSQNPPLPIPSPRAVSPSPPPVTEGQRGYMDGTAPSRLRKCRKSRERKRRSEKRRGKGKAGHGRARSHTHLGKPLNTGHRRARSHTHLGKPLNTAFTSSVGKDGENSTRKELFK